MNASEQRAGVKTLFRWLAGASTLLFACSRFLPCASPTRGHTVEDSWVQVLHTAFAEHWQFGRDLVFTFGPWGFLYGGYLPETHGIALAAWLGLSVVFWWAGWKLAHHLSGNELAAWLWLVGFIGLAGLANFLNIDGCLSAFVALWLALYFFVEDRPLTAAQAALVVCLGLLGLVKFSLLVETAMILALVAADTVFRRRRFPWVALVFAASVLCCWMAAGQRLGSFRPFVANSLQITGGYTEGMMFTPRHEGWSICGFAACAGLLGAAVGYAGWAQRRFWGVLPAAAWLLTLFLAFKYGYVRHDGHEVTAAKELLLMAVVTLACVLPMAARKGQGMVLAGLLPTVIILLFASVTYSRYLQTGLMAKFAQILSVPNAAARLKVACGGELREDYQDYLAYIRKNEPLPALPGATDVYPWDQALLLGNGLTYRPRPVFQSYSAYTPRLAELNAAFLRSDRAPDNILFQVRIMDERFPALDDGLSWPELMTRYDVQQAAAGGFVLLKRAATPREWRLTPLTEKSIGFGEKLALPPGTNGPVWAKIEIEPSWAGALVSALFKPPILWLEVETRDGGKERYRLVPGMARGGFLLSPVIGDGAAFRRLATTGAGPETDEVSAITLWADNATGTTACYQSPMRVRLYRLDFARQP